MRRLTVGVLAVIVAVQPTPMIVAVVVAVHDGRCRRWRWRALRPIISCKLNVAAGGSAIGVEVVVVHFEVRGNLIVLAHVVVSLQHFPRVFGFLLGAAFHALLRARRVQGRERSLRRRARSLGGRTSWLHTGWPRWVVRLVDFASFAEGLPRVEHSLMCSVQRAVGAPSVRKVELEKGLLAGHDSARVDGLVLAPGVAGCAGIEGGFGGCEPQRVAAAHGEGVLGLRRFAGADRRSGAAVRVAGTQPPVRRAVHERGQAQSEGGSAGQHRCHQLWCVVGGVPTNRACHLGNTLAVGGAA
jgi:hypothetical protein